MLWVIQCGQDRWSQFHLSFGMLHEESWKMRPIGHYVYKWRINLPTNPFHHSLTSSISIMNKHHHGCFPSFLPLKGGWTALDKYFDDFFLNSNKFSRQPLKWLRRLTIHSNLTEVIFFRLLSLFVRNSNLIDRNHFTDFWQDTFRPRK